VKIFDACKTRIIGLSYCEKNCDNMLSRFHLIPERYGQTDRQTDRIAISISRVSVLTRHKKLRVAQKYLLSYPNSIPTYCTYCFRQITLDFLLFCLCLCMRGLCAFVYGS